jgi:glyoxylase-like metal-dependent hydrolase (beta-lactamase superfamily II)
VTVTEVAPGLRRWTSFHDHWEEEVGSVAVDTADGLVLIDPIEPPPELAKPAHALFTVYWHARSGAELRGARTWASSRSRKPLENRGIQVTDIAAPDGELPGGIRALQTPRAAEVVYYLPEQRAVVVGDVLLGAGAKPRRTDDPLRLCPERWLGKATHADLRHSLAPLLELPFERVLVSHGSPVLADAKRELEQLLRV